MNSTIANRARFSPTTPEELQGRWVIVRSSTGTVSAARIFDARFDYVAGFTAADLENDQPVSLSWQALDSNRMATAAPNVPVGTELILATDEEVSAWIETTTARLVPKVSAADRKTPMDVEIQELILGWEEERRAQAALIAAL